VDIRQARPAIRPSPCSLTFSTTTAIDRRYANGRFITDDVYDMRMAFLTHGQARDGVGPHDDYLPELPFLGVPLEQTSGAVHPGSKGS
jgi:hypothetical protein